MSDRSGTGEEASVAGLLEVVERDREERCRRIRAEAVARVAELVRAERREARRRVTDAVRAERDRAEQRREAVLAELLTREREIEQSVGKALVARCWDRLRAVLVARWGEPISRARWTMTLVEQARKVLPVGTWLVEHPRALLPSEVAAQIGPASGRAPSLSAKDEIRAGLRLSSEGVTLDGTLQGLLADRSSVEGRLLMELSRASASHESAGS